MTGTVAPNIPSKGDALGTSDKKTRESLVTLRDSLNAVLNSENKVPSLGTWYTPKVIATEESRTNTAFGTLTTPDELTNVVLPANGLICIGYIALIKSSVSAAGRVTFFLNSTQVQVAGSTTPVGAERETLGTGFTTFISAPRGLFSSGGSGALVTTGMALGASEGTNPGGFCYVFAAAGTYNISVQFKATSGSITAKERKLWVAVLGV